MNAPPPDGRKIGQLLLDAGLVTEAQLNESLERQRQEGGRLCSHLVRLGYLKADNLLEFLRLQFGVAAVNLSHYRIPPDVLALVPANMAREHRVVPVTVVDNTLHLAMEDPRDAEAIARIGEQTGMAVEPLISPQAVIEEALQRYYGAEEAPFASVPERKLLVLDDKSDQPAIFDVKQTPRGLSPLNWLKRVVYLGIKRRSREFHLEPREHDMLVRYRLGSRLVNGESIPLTAAALFAPLLLSHAGQKPDARGAPREGWVNLRVKQRELKIFFAVFPVIYGERVVIKLVDEGTLRRPLPELGLDENDFTRLMQVLSRRSGLVVLASPTVEDAHWLLYHVLDTIKSDNLNVLTVEPALLMPLPGVSQTLSSAGKGRKLKELVLACLRQEPDILGLVGLDDYELLETVTNSSSRCLIIATAQRSDTLDALHWLQRSRMGSMALAQLLAGVLALRVVPRLCPACRRIFEGRVEMLEGTRDMHPADMRFYESPGCARCEGTGRAGTIGVFETFLPDDEIRDLITTAAPAKVIHEEAQRRGMKTILEDGLIKAARGEVDVRDVLKVAPGTGSE